ncbi:MAG TPA: PAS domain-containing protein [Archangium sp.]|jgi:PAS domain S-box-containing protein|uniref:sensor histidine kinase n=1 Tax=Archangium sp. TaxID=1872627 RepID=UPI002ED8760A
MSGLADLLEARLEEVVRRWADSVRQHLAPGGESDSALKDHLPDLLRQLVATLRGHTPPGGTSPVSGENPVGQASEAHRLDVLESIGDAFFSLDPTWRVRAVNSRYEELARKRREDCLGRDFWELFPEAATPGSKYWTEYHRVMEQRTPVQFVEYFTPLDLWTETRVHPIKDGGIAVFFRDVSEQKRAQEALRESEQRLRLVIDALPNLINFVGTDQRYRLNNKTYEAWFGVPFDSLRGKTVREVVGEENYGHIRPYIERALRGERVTYQVPFVFGEGRRGFIGGTHVPQVDPHGQVLGYATLVSDITEQHAAETALRMSEERVRGLLESTAEGIWGLDTEGRCTFANPACVRLLGYDSAEELVGRDMHALTHHHLLDGTPYPGAACRIHEAFRTGRALIVEDEVLWRRDGTPLSVRYRASPILRDGQTVGAVVSFEDVTERKAAVEALRESKEHLSRVVEASGAGTWEIDPLTRAFTADAPLRALHELPPEGELDLETGLAPIHPEDRERVRDAVAAALAGRDAGHYLHEFRVVSREGRIRWVETRGRAYFDAEGKAVRFLGTGLDVTRRKEAELAREGLLEALAAQPSLLVCVLEGPEFVHRLAPPAYLRRVARGRDLLGKPIFEAVPELKGQGFEALLTRVLETGEPFVGREVPASFDRGDGTLEEGFFDVVYQPVRGEEGGFDSILAISHEVTDVVHARRRAERLIAEEKERATFEQQLIGIVSHDLRSPISAILLGAQGLLRREGLDERSLKAVVRIQSSAERAARMVRDLLDFTQARLAGGIPLHPRPTSLHDLARSVVDEVQGTHPERDVHLVLEGDLQGQWDPDRLSQALTNLLINAVKYGTEGTPVSLRAREVGDSVHIEVHNRGTPIPQEQLGRLFAPMQRGTNQQDTGGRSVGLGLYIVEQIARAHGGRIEVRSTLEEGTTFTLRLPRRPQPGAAS